MRKYLVITLVLITFLLLVWSVALGAVGKRWDERYGYFETTFITKAVTQAENNYVLLPVVTGLRYVIYRTIFCAGVAAYYYGNDTGIQGVDAWGLLYAVDGGTVIDDGIKKLDVSAALYTNFSGTSWIGVEYRLE